MFLNGSIRSAGLRVAVVRPIGGTPLITEATTRLGAVLLAAGFDLVEVEARREIDPRRAREPMSEGPRTFATLALEAVGSGAAIEVTIHDLTTGRTSARQITVAERPAQPSAASSRDIALQALELLRATLLETAAASSWGGGAIERDSRDSRVVQRGRAQAGDSKNVSGL